jgi:hypothetical protein
MAASALSKQTYEHPTAAGALMFSCLGRGEGLYGQPNFDSQLFTRYLNNIPLGASSVMVKLACRRQHFPTYLHVSIWDLPSALSAYLCVL